MREIKFRAWDKELKQMLTGLNQYGADEPDAVYKERSCGAFTRLWEALARFKESQRFELMQFTGLKDKNGKEIYGGDIIVKRGDIIVKNRGLVVEYIVGMSGYYLMRNGEGFHLSHEQNILDGKIKHIEVIGNVWENPELLKEATK